MSASRKGNRRERELVNKLDDDDFGVIRAPASGSANRELPDVFAGNGTLFLAIEVKSSKGDTIYIKEKEIKSLVFFAESFQAIPLLGVRFDREDWYFFHPSDMYRTDSGNYRVKRSTAISDGIAYHELNELSAPVTDSAVPLEPGVFRNDF